MNMTPSNDFSRTGDFTCVAFTLKRVFSPVTMINGISGLIFLSQQVFGSFKEYKRLANEIGFLNDFFKILLYLEAINIPLATHCTVFLNPQQIKTSAMLHVDWINPTFTRARLACAKSKSTEQNQKPSNSLEGEIENMKHTILLDKKRREIRVRKY